MVDYKYKELFYQNSMDKQWKIEYDGGSISNEDLFSQSIELTETLCSETELRFGCCEASVFKFKVANIVKPLMNEWLTVSVVIEHYQDTPLIIGRYKVISDIHTADRRHREIVAYDAMYDILNADVAAWYHSILPEKNSSVTVKQLRESFLRNFGLSEMVPQGGLVNDNISIARTIEPEQLSGRDVITAICELNGCFGHIGRDGKFHYIYLNQDMMGLYPSNTLFPDHAPDYLPQADTGHLYPQQPQSERIENGLYINCQFEDLICKKIDQLQIRQEENDIGQIWPEGELKPDDNCYIIEDNFLVYGKSASQLRLIAANIYEKITNVIYRPFDCEAVGNPCLEVGDSIRILTKYEIVESYIFERTLKGIQALRDVYKSSGTETYADKVNGVKNSIIQLKGKTNVLERSVEVTRSTITDVEGRLSSRIEQTADRITQEVADRTEAGQELVSKIEQTAEKITQEVADRTEAEQELVSKIEQTAEKITQEVSDRTEAGQELVSKIEQTADRITQEIADRTEAGQELVSKIEQTADRITQEVTDRNEAGEVLAKSIDHLADEINLKVNEGDVSNQISIERGGVFLNSNRFHVDSDNFKLNGSGEIKATGTIKTGYNERYAELNKYGLEFYYNDALVGEICASVAAEGRTGMALETEKNYILFAVKDKPDTSSVKYIMNNGLEALTERHVFRDDVRISSLHMGNKIHFGETSYFKETDVAGMEVLTIKADVVQIDGSLEVLGTHKNRAVQTSCYGNIKMNAFETADAYFSDIGSGTIKDGACYVFFDAAFAETIEVNVDYQVFLTQTSKEKTTYVEKKNAYFIVYGEDNATFDWMITAKQKDCQSDRMERAQNKPKEEIPYNMSIFYGEEIAPVQSETYARDLDVDWEKEADIYLNDFNKDEQRITEMEELK